MYFETILLSYSVEYTIMQKQNAGVSCVIVGLRKINNDSKYIYKSSLRQKVQNINAYLINSEDIIIKKRRKVISNLPNISDGSGALDGGHLILSTEEKNKLLTTFPKSIDFIRPYLVLNPD